MGNANSKPAGSTPDETVNDLLDCLEKLKPTYYLDGDDSPCIRVVLDKRQHDWRLLDRDGRPSQRSRAFLRTQFWEATSGTRHLGDAELRSGLDHLVEKAYRGGLLNSRTGAEKQGDYNFEAVVAFAGTLTKHSPGTTVDASRRTLTYQAKTEDLWKAIDGSTVKAQVTAPKTTLCKTLNWFSRRLGELKYQFSKEGLEVSVTHKEDGSWVKIVRHDDIFHPGPALATPDDNSSSSSGSSSGSNTRGGKALQADESTQMETDTPDKEIHQ